MKKKKIWVDGHTKKVKLPYSGKTFTKKIKGHWRWIDK